ncbi:hypothetical protein KIH86_09370 [Paenibacillus sp. HN-1]|uniref:hypothetical protein n=1 Tax=Paenibacillus TaxID=44249 RepID=UPI001CAA020F|nr:MULTISPECIES: hypothetical protein [Paenibacillus]MBY9077166.1 hypothetical protein [Paenibacillus sp. CGMCC 1.18879]MBY9084438.1 hypothetical protein [Paenibacillus sinensis]
MGCDIHLLVEKKIDGKWQAVKGVNEPEIEECKGYIEKCKERGQSAAYSERRLEELRQGTYDYLYEGRHYLLFEVLAGVRAGHDLVPVAVPKGLPEDISPEAKESTEGWGADGHSHSWLTAGELNAYNWDQTITREGWVGVEQFKRFLEVGEPYSWSRGVGGGMVQHITNQEMKERIRDNYWFPLENSNYYYTLINWNKNLRDALGTFCSWSIPKLAELAGDDPESARIVFWFDN